MDLEAERHDRVEGRRDLLALQRCVRALVDDDGRTRHVEERQEHAGRHEDDEEEQRDLTEQERPVIREDLAQAVANDPGDAGPRVEPPHEAHERATSVLARLGGSSGVAPGLAHTRMSQKLGPTGSG